MHLKPLSLSLTLRLLALSGPTLITVLAEQPNPKKLALAASAVEPLLPTLPTTAAVAIHPDTYSSLQLSHVPGFFEVLPQEKKQVVKYNTSAVDGGGIYAQDLQFDRTYPVRIDTRLYQPKGQQAAEGGVDAVPPVKRWAALKAAVEAGNRRFVESGAATRLKVLFLARHGQGYHNVASKKYAADNGWECYWAMQPGDDEATWGPDAKLTPQGIQEAKLKGAIWRKHIADGAPIPERHFVSPLSRSIRTMEETWKDIYGWLGSAPHPRAPRGVKPVVTEILRETMNLHYSDHRSPLNTLHLTYPYLLFSPLPQSHFTPTTPSFPNADPYWDFHRESPPLRDLRIKTALQQLVHEAGNATHIGVTAHWGVIESALGVLGHGLVPALETTGVVPVVVRVEPGVRRVGEGSWYERYAGRRVLPVVFRRVCEGREWGAVWVAGGYSDADGGVGVAEE